MTNEWERIRKLKSEIEALLERRQGLNENIKELREELEGEIEEGEDDEDLRKLRVIWVKLATTELNRKQLSGTINRLKLRLDMLIRTGEDPADDGQLNIDELLGEK